MLDASAFMLFLAAAVVLALTPGPGIFYVAARTLAGGRAEGVASSLGTGLGGLLHVLAGAVGVSALVMASDQLFTGLKWLGACYLVWLGLRTWRSSRAGGAMTSETSPALGRRRAFQEGVWVEALNPKTAAFFLAFIPQFIEPSAGRVSLQFMALGLVSVALNTSVDVLVALGADRIRQSAANHPQRIQRLRQASGAALVALGLGLLLARQPLA